MADRRSGPPLFDLMRERGEHPDAHNPVPKAAHPPTPAQSTPTPIAHRQPITPESTKQTAWDTSGGVSRAERSAATMLDAHVETDSGIRLSSPAAYLLIAVVLASIIGAWAFGYNRGEKAGKAEIEQYVQDQPVVRPAAKPDVFVQPAGTEPAATISQPDPGISQSTPSLRSAIMDYSGFIGVDPRVSGNNYLVLATLSPEQASDAISFLYSHGVRVIGVPQVDSRAPSANNPSRYTLYSLGVAIPGNRWSAMSTQRIEHQQLIANLGARWQREQRGVSDFSQTNWEKYEP